MVTASTDSLIEQLYRVEGKAEIVDGRIQLLPSMGGLPAQAAGEIGFSLHRHIRSAKLAGVVSFSKAAFLVELPNRKSISPDVAYYEGPDSGMKFFEGAPQFAVEIRSEEECGFAAERAMEQKRRDCFAAGTTVVWDVDLQSDKVVRKYTLTNGSDVPVAVYRRGEAGDAEPAIRDWTLPMSNLWREDVD